MYSLEQTAPLLKKIVDGNVIKTEVPTTAMPFSERLVYCAERTLIGLMIVFGVLAIIWLVLSLFKVVFAKGPAAAGTPSPAEHPAEVNDTATAKDEEIVAAIMAAITAMRAESGETDAFRVVSFKRTHKAGSWNRIG